MEIITMVSLLFGFLLMIVTLAFAIAVPILMIVALVYLIKWLKRKTE